MRVLSIFATFATALAVLGACAAIAHAVSLRNREIGIRVALGAGPDEARYCIFSDRAPLPQESSSV
jgi:hypothetical protein